jgi:hypothetical protein
MRQPRQERLITPDFEIERTIDGIEAASPVAARCQPLFSQNPEHHGRINGFTGVVGW